MTTPQEVIKIMEACRFHYMYKDSELCDDMVEAYNIAIEALERQISRVPYFNNGYECPNCHRDFYVAGFPRYCESCGQKINWEE